MWEKEKVDCEKELEKCYELLQKLDLISADYTDCQIKLSQTINNMNNGCIIDGVGVGVESLNKRKNQMANNLDIVDSGITKVRQRIKELIDQIKRLKIKIQRLTAEIAQLHAELAAALAAEAAAAAAAAAAKSSSSRRSGR